MICKNCGAELPPNTLYCLQCGHEIQIVSEVTLLEDDLLTSMLDENSADSLEQLEKDADAEYERAEKKRQHKSTKRKKEFEKKRKRRNAAFVILLLLILVGALGGFLFYRHTHSISYYLQKAYEAQEEHYDQETLKYTEKVLELDPENETALWYEGNAYLNMGSYEEAEQIYLSLMELDPTSEQYCQALIDLYQVTDDYDSLKALRDQTTDPALLALFSGYVLEAPSINVSGGKLDKYPEIRLESTDSDVRIFYTLDGSVPTTSDTLYEEPFTIEEQGEVTLTAICVNAKGRYSDPSSETYEIELEIPDMPQVSPNGGEFTQETRIFISAPADTSIYYSWTNPNPDENSSEYTDPIPVIEGNNVLYVVAIDVYGMSSNVTKCNFIYYPEQETTVSETDEITQGNVPTQQDTVIGDDAVEVGNGDVQELN